MAITIRKKQGDRILELGGGANPNPSCDCNVDVRPCYDAQGNSTVHFTCDFNNELPIRSEEWDGIFSQYCLEHISWRKTKLHISEIFRILKNGGKAIVVVPNTEAQIRWIENHPEGWDGKDDFESFSCVLYGDQDYPENSHKCYLSPSIITRLFREIGFDKIVVQFYGERNTDMLIEATKPLSQQEKKREEYSKVNEELGAVPIAEFGFTTNVLGSIEKETVKVGEVIEKSEAVISEKLHNRGKEAEAVDKRKSAVLKTESIVGKIVYENLENPRPQSIVLTEKILVVKPKTEMEELLSTTKGRQEVFGSDYFNGGKLRGGYAREGYWDYPIHAVTALHVLARKPKSVLELGAGRNYIVKRLQDAGVSAYGMEISKHCYMTRAADNFIRGDICETPWFKSSDEVFLEHNDGLFDLCFSCACLEHIPEEFLPAVVREMAKTCQRGLHGVDFGEKDDSFDKSHISLHDKKWWNDLFHKYAQGWPVEIVNKEELEQGNFPQEVLNGDGRLKLNIGSYTQMFHHGWTNLDILDLNGFAQPNGYRFQQYDIRNGIPYGTGTVDYIFASHFLEHLNYDEGIRFLRECRRAIRPDGAMRIIVPDAQLLITAYCRPGLLSSDKVFGRLEDFDEISNGAASRSTAVGKLYELLCPGHNAFYDWETLQQMLSEVGFNSANTGFRQGHKQILSETIDMFPCHSLYVSAAPLIG